MNIKVMAVSILLGVVILGCATAFLDNVHRRERVTSLKMVRAESKEPLYSLFDGLNPIAHFAAGNWRGPETLSSRGPGRDGLLWRVGVFLGLVGSVHAQTNCSDQGCYGAFIAIESQSCDCGVPPGSINVATLWGDDFCAGQMSDGELDCTNDGCGLGVCDQQICTNPSCGCPPMC